MPLLKQTMGNNVLNKNSKIYKLFVNIKILWLIKMKYICIKLKWAYFLKFLATETCWCPQHKHAKPTIKSKQINWLFYLWTTKTTSLPARTIAAFAASWLQPLTFSPQISIMPSPDFSPDWPDTLFGLTWNTFIGKKL